MSKIPKNYNNLREDFPEVGKVYHNFGEAVTIVRTLDDKTRALVKSAIFLVLKKNVRYIRLQKSLVPVALKKNFKK